MRPVLGALAVVLLSRRGFEPLGFRCLGDWSRERLGVGARAVREWARAEVWPQLRWNAHPSRKRDRLARLARGPEECSPCEIDRRLRAAIAFLKPVDFEIGRILRQVVERKLYCELGFESFERYVQERLDLSVRTARRLVRLARAEHGAPALASAFREGRITLLQAEVLLRGGAICRAITSGSARRGEVPIGGRQMVTRGALFL